MGRAVPHHFLSPQSLETRTSLSHPRRPRLCQDPADGGGRLPVEERKQHLQLFCVGPTAQAPAAGRGHVVTRAIPLSLSPDRLEQSMPPWASGFRPQRLFPHHHMRSLGTDRVEKEPGSSAHQPSSSTPSLRPQTLHPCPALCHQPHNNPVTADVTASSGWKDP